MRFALLVLTLSAASLVAAPEKTTRVVGSVSDILIARLPHQEFVEVLLRIHSPSELSGATLVLITDTRDRGRTRKQMPLGSLYLVTLPDTTIVDLKKQREHQEYIEKSVDQGTPPEIISDMVTLTQVQLTDLPAPVTPFPLKP